MLQKVPFFSYMPRITPILRYGNYSYVLFGDTRDLICNTFLTWQLGTNTNHGVPLEGDEQSRTMNQLHLITASSATDTNFYLHRIL